MNEKSRICCFLAEHGEDDWETILRKEYGIKTKKSMPYAIFNYTFECDFANPLVQEARGIIINLETLEVACWPFRKFGNYNESYADEIDWSSARVQDKVDGSIIKLWYDAVNEEWKFATNGTIDAYQAEVGEGTGKYFGEVIQRADNYGDIPFPELNKDCTYIFELVSPQTQVVVQYGGIHLYHTGTRNNKTGEEYDMEIGVEKPEMYPLKSMEDCMQAVRKLNGSSADGKVTKEGFVVVDGNWNRVKLKSPEYLFYHQIAEVCKLPKQQIIEMLWENTLDVYAVCKNFPQHAHIVKYYDYRVEELKYRADVFVEKARRIYEEYYGDRKLTAEAIGKERLSAIGFAGLGNKLPGRELLKKKTIKYLADLIPDYVSCE